MPTNPARVADGKCTDLTHHSILIEEAGTAQANIMKRQRDGVLASWPAGTEREEEMVVAT